MDFSKGAGTSYYSVFEEAELCDDVKNCDFDQKFQFLFLSPNRFFSFPNDAPTLLNGVSRPVRLARVMKGCQIKHDFGDDVMFIEGEFVV